ncbi:MAG TPA: amidohydrolase family protein [Draconibacterium sp.]|nr:amidohydrolase family protein [Draconibacterium sp.]
MNASNLILLLFSVLLISCTSNNYTMEDFTKIKKTDAHYHIYSSDNNSMEQAQKDNFRLLAINTFSDNCERVADVQKQSAELFKNYPSDFAYTTTFCLDGWDDSTWVENTTAWLDSCIADGAIAVKVWKNIGMEFRDKDSLLIMIDDPKFDPIFKHLAEKGIPLVGHLGEPKNCWLSFNEMTTKNDSNYFAENPQYHMFLHPEFPSYEEQIAARDRMLDKNPELVFIGCHLASLEWSVDELAKWLDKYPNAAVDMAARMGQLFYQTRDNREKVRDFLIKYQDRILYGTDIIDHGQEKEVFQKRMHETWLKDWEFLVTEHKMTSNLVDGEFSGLQLPKEVVDKIYAGNAKMWYELP